MRSSSILKNLASEKRFRVYDSTTNITKQLEIKPFVSKKAIELQNLGLCLYYCENAKNQPEELIFETENKEWWLETKDAFEEIYYYLTNKKIALTFEQIGSEITSNDQKERIDKGPSGKKLILFSGGLDSLIGSLYMEKKKEDFILSHTITSFNMFGKAKRVYSSSPLLTRHEFINIDSRFKSGNLAQKSPNARTLIFVLNSIPVCEFFNIRTIIVPENAVLMVNPPISQYATPTKTTRPELMKALSEVLKSFLDYNISIELPFINYTKAEMIASFKDQFDILNNSYSCFGYRGRKIMCGKCYGCFIRKVSFAANLIIESNRYENDVFLLKEPPENKDENDRFLIIQDLIKFCRGILLKETIDADIEDSINNANVFERVDLWDIMTRFSQDVFLGIRNYYTLKKLNFSDYILGKASEKIFASFDSSFFEKRQNSLLNFTMS